ncbi:YicC family protein [Hyphococcus flavus]|uniref:YicC family protein n=1 Tax=Hyphococcus flavus TaxID=1866326 RepID=A0AAE9ZAL9_9PROT|nr:YicC/YloC family endoribonuclease [Hyphococcus flavus]WDI30743.1 YicC family protein [Hyphococcus flavus]
MKSTLASMTGFARADGAHDRWRWNWEVRTVNARGLEWRCRVPSGYEGLDPSLRKALKNKITRGSFNASLTISSSTDAPQYRINEAMLANVLGMIEKLRSDGAYAQPQPEGVLAIRGVVEPMDEALEEKERNDLFADILASFEKAVDDLVNVRRKEGEALAGVLASQLDQIEDFTGKAAALAASTPDAIKSRIEAQLTELLSEGKIPEDRLAQEAALLAVKADIREELDRLASHVEMARSLLQKNAPVGRELDFLTQEFNREANTLCSKAQDMELKRIGLDLKRVIDQLREQVQNVE